jgi:actin-related protein
MCKVGVVSDDNPQTVFPSLIGGPKDFITFGTSEYYMGDEE